MAQKIIFENQIAKVIEERVLFECKTEDMIEQYLKHQPIRTKLLPRNCVFYERRATNKSVVIIERCPQIMRVKHSQERGSQEMKIMKISVPFFYMSMHVNEESESPIGTVYPFCTFEPISKMEDQIFVLPLPNIYDDGDGSFCLGHINLRPNKSIKIRAEEIVEQLISSQWNQDLSYDLPENITDWDDWQKKSTENPMLWKSLVLRKHVSQTVDGIVNRSFNEVR